MSLVNTGLTGDPNALQEKLDNVFNKMLLLTTNLLVNIPGLIRFENNQDTVITEIREVIDTNILNGDVTSQIDRLTRAYKQRLDSSSIFNSSADSRTACINYDLLSLNGDLQGDDNAKIQQIAVLFYKYVLEVHLYSFYCIVKALGLQGNDRAAGVFPGHKGGVLFENPLFTSYGGSFVAADGIHDAEPRGDMVGSEFVPKTGKSPAKGGWEIIKNEIGKDSRERLIDSIRKSSTIPTESQSDDITKSINIKWDSLNKTTGHHLLDPIESSNRLVCNIELQELVKLSSSQLLNSSNRFKIVKVNEPNVKDKESANIVKRTTEIVRKIYGIGSLSNNFAISDCSGPTPEELHEIVASSNSTQVLEDLGNDDDDYDDDDEDEDSGAGSSKKKKSKSKKGPRGNVTAFISHIMDSSKGNSAGGINKLRQITGLNDLNGVVTFLLPHTRWTFEAKKGSKPAKGSLPGQILHVFQRVIIDFRGPAPAYKIRFEAWRTNSTNPSQAYPNTFLSTSDFFELKESDKCPGVNETIRYIFSTDFIDENNQKKNIKKTKPGDFAERYVEKMFPDKKTREQPLKNVKLARVFFDKFLKACEDMLSRTEISLKQAMGNVPLFKMAFLFRQKTMGDYLRLADTAYLNEILWVANKKLGIGVEGTCDGYSGIKAMASNNCPVILCEAKEWGKNFTMYSSLALNQADADRAAAIERRTVYVEKTRKTMVKLDELQIEYFQFKQLGIDATLKRIYDNMKVAFYILGKDFLEKVVVDKLLSFNNNIIRYTLVLNDALAMDSRLEIKRANYEIDDSKYSITQISESVENTLAVLGLFLLMFTYVTNWLSYWEQYKSIYYNEIKRLNAEIDAAKTFDTLEQGLTDAQLAKGNTTVNKCISLAPSTFELNKIVTFLESCNKVVPNWSKTPESVQELTSELLTVNLKKKDPRLKKIVDKGIPDFLSQEKNTTVNYVSLVNYKQVVSALNDMFSSLHSVKPDINEPSEQSDIPLINSIFNSGILNEAVKEHFLYWFELIPIAKPPGVQGVPLVEAIQIEITPEEVEQAEAEAYEADKNLNKVKAKADKNLNKVEAKADNPEAIKALAQAVAQADKKAIETRVKFSRQQAEKQKDTTPRIKKFLSAVKAVTSGNYFLRSLSSMRQLRSSSIIPARQGGGGQTGGATNFYDLLSPFILSATGEINGDTSITSDFYPHIEDYLPLLDGNDYKRLLKDQESRSTDLLSSHILKQLEKKYYYDEDELRAQIMINDDLSEILSSGVGDVERSFNELVTSSDFKENPQEEQEESTSNRLALEINHLNENLLTTSFLDVKNTLQILFSSSKSPTIYYILQFLEQLLPEEQPEASEELLNYESMRNGISSLLNIFFKFFTPFEIGPGFSATLTDSLVSFFVLKEEKSFEEIITLKLKLLFSKLLETPVFNSLFSKVIPELFFRKSSKIYKTDTLLRKRVIYFVVRDNYGLPIDNIILDQHRRLFEMLTVCALLYDDTLLTNAVSELYFKDKGTAQLVLPNLTTSDDGSDDGAPRPPTQEELVAFYNEYYTETQKSSANFPIPLEPTCLPFLLLSRCKDGESTPLITDANVGVDQTSSSKCKELIIKPLIDYFWDDYCSYALKSGIKDAVKYRLMFQYKNATDEEVKKLLTDYLYCYLFDTCKIAKNHNGIIMDNVPGTIIELNLVQYTKMAGRTYLSYSAAELQEMVGKFMNLDGGREEKTPAGWNVWADPLAPGAVKLEGRPENTQELMEMFTGDVLVGVVSNYSYFSKRQKRELGIDDLVDGGGQELKNQISDVVSGKARTLMELFNIVLFRVAFVNIENVNVAMVSLLSEKLGSYLSNPEELFADINSGIDLDDPVVKVYNYFISLFLPPPPEALDADGKLKDDAQQMLVTIIEKTISDQEFKKDLRRIISSNPKLINIILSIIGSTEPGKNSYFYKILKSFARTVDEKGELEGDKKAKKMYYDFLKSLLPKGALPSPSPPSPPSPPVTLSVSDKAKKGKGGEGGSRSHKNSSKKKNRSFSRKGFKLI